MDSKNCKVELRTLRSDWYEKGTDTVVIHFYVKDVTSCSLMSEENKGNMVDICFSTSNQTFWQRNTDSREVGAGPENVTFWYRLYPCADVLLEDSSCFAKSTLIEVRLQKKLPVPWKSLESREIMLARQKGNPGLARNTTQKSNEDCKSVNHEYGSGSDPQPVINGTASAGMPRMFMTSTGHDNFVKENSLLGGKSTPISKGEQSEKEKKDEGASCSDDQQPSCSATDPDALSANKSVAVRPETLGMNGLENFANNCYMNVVVQVLANVTELKDYFASDSYLASLNVGNLLGSGGKVAKAFSDVVKLLWCGGKRCFKPLILKNIMSKRCSLFLGFQQCDAQEFFSSLLDNLHEDLNQGKIDRGAECSGKETDGPTVNEKSNTAWMSHSRRNNSMIVKLFHGQLVSKLTCASCHKVSYSYDPCAQISLPIPMEKKLLNVVLFFKDSRKTPWHLKIQISTLNAQIWHLVNMVARRVGIPAHCLKAFPVSQGQFQPTLCENASLRSILDAKFAVVCECRGDDEDMISLPVLQNISGPLEFQQCSFCAKQQDALSTKLKRCTRCSIVAYCGRDCQTRHWGVHRIKCRKDAKVQIGLPFVVTIKKSVTSLNTFKETLLNYAQFSIKEEVFVESAEKGAAKTVTQLPIDGQDAVDDTSLTTGEGSMTTHNEGPSCNYIIRAYPHHRPESEPFVLRHDDFKVEKLASIAYLSLDWCLQPVGDENTPKIRERSPPLFHSIDGSPFEEQSQSDKCSLDDCLSLFMEPERLSEGESWRCPKCKTPQAARKEMSISYPPPILLFHLKRFTYGDVAQKVSKPVHYRISNFELSPYVSEETRSLAHVPYLYDLVGVICHKGSLRMGHYVCMVRSLDSNDTEDVGWRFIDDEEVTRIREDKVNSPEAYMLIYRLRGINQLLKMERNVLAPPTVLEDQNTHIQSQRSLRSSGSDNDTNVAVEAEHVLENTKTDIVDAKRRYPYRDVSTEGVTKDEDSCTAERQSTSEQDPDFSAINRTRSLPGEATGLEHSSTLLAGRSKSTSSNDVEFSNSEEISLSRVTDKFSTMNTEDVQLEESEKRSDRVNSDVDNDNDPFQIASEAFITNLNVECSSSMTEPLRDFIPAKRIKASCNYDTAISETIASDEREPQGDLLARVGFTIDPADVTENDLD